MNAPLEGKSMTTDVADIIQREVDKSITEWDIENAGERAERALAEAGVLGG